MEHKSCPELMFLGFLYMVPLAFSALAAFPNLSLSGLWIPGWLFMPGFTGFALFIFGTQMELGEMVLKGLLVVSGVHYGVVGYAGLLSTNTWAAGTAVWVFGAVLLIDREKKAVATGLILAR